MAVAGEGFGEAKPHSPSGETTATTPEASEATRTAPTVPQSPAGPAGGQSARDATPVSGAAQAATSAQPGSNGSEPQYAEPVDPWATGEAAWAAGYPSGAYPVSNPPAYPGASWPSTTPAMPGSPGMPGTAAMPPHPGQTAMPPHPGPGAMPPHPGPGAVPGSGGPAGKGPGPHGRPYRKGMVALIAAAVTLVVGAGVAAAVVWWPRDRAIEFHTLSPAKTFDPVIEVSYNWTETATLGDRAYFVSSDSDGYVGVVAVDTKAAEKVWSSRRTGPARWSSSSQMIALPVGVALVSDPLPSDYQTRRVVVLGAKDGRLLWEATLASEDRLYFGRDVLVVNYGEEKKVRGLGLADGKVKWTRDNPGDDLAGRGSWLVPVTTPEDLATPVNAAGVRFGPVIGEDGRLVQVSPDGSVRMLDAASGDIGRSGRQVATFEDAVLAHNGRLIVWESSRGKRVVSYDLAKFGEPTVLYSPDANTRVKSLIPCGDDRVCVLEEDRADSKKTRIRAVPADRNGELWTADLPEVETIVPVGESVLARTDDKTTLIKPDGVTEWEFGGPAARIDGGNVLRFFGRLNASAHDIALSGVHVGDTPVELGAMPDVRSTTCSWNSSAVACVAESTFVVQRFAD